MPTQPANLTPWVRSGLAALCILLAVSVSVRSYAYWQRLADGAPAWEASGQPVDLGGGATLPRAAAAPFTIRVAPCASPVAVDFLRASPYEPDPSLVGRPQPGDRVFYVYRGRDLGTRFVTIRLNAIYLARLAYARLTGQDVPAADDLALKIIVPAGCEASADHVTAVLRTAYPPPVPSALRDRAPPP